MTFVEICYKTPGLLLPLKGIVVIYQPRKSVGEPGVVDFKAEGINL